MEEQFRKLVRDASTVIREIDPEDLKFGLINLPVKNKKQHEEFFTQNWSEISNASKIVDIWYQLSSYWDFLNYTLLEYLIHEFCSSNEVLVGMMNDYKARLNEFRCNTLLCEFAEEFKSVNKCLVDMKKLQVVLDKDWEECTLEDLENWQKNITQKLLLPSFVMILQDINSGSVSVTWAIPTVYAIPLIETLKTTDMKEFCKDHRIISLRIDDSEFAFMEGN